MVPQYFIFNRAKWRLQGRMDNSHAMHFQSFVFVVQLQSEFKVWNKLFSMEWTSNINHKVTYYLHTFKKNKENVRSTDCFYLITLYYTKITYYIKYDFFSTKKYIFYNSFVFWFICLDSTSIFFMCCFCNKTNKFNNDQLFI